MEAAGIPTQYIVREDAQNGFIAKKAIVNASGMPQGQRKLAAIMFTDMVGYTALGQRNEALSLALVEEQRKLIRPVLNRHNGREVKTMGDAFMVEFSSALDAVRCAYDIQRATREANVSLPNESKIHLRIGIHSGDVIEQEGDISGDAVNVASRIEPLAEDGGVCVTRPVYESVRNKIDVPLVSLGTRSLKNVIEPMDVYKMEMPWEKEGVETERELDSKRLAVLPFVSLSPDPNDEYFADGLTEELIDRVCQVRDLAVIARTSVMNYKGAKKSALQIGKELKAGALVEGSVRKAGNKIRVTAQLINANTEEHLWSSRYDRGLEDVFAVQSDIAEKIAGALRIRLLPAERKAMEKQPTKSSEAYVLYLKGRYCWNERTEEGMKKGIQYFEKAAEIDSNYALAYVGVADSYRVLVDHGHMAFSEGQPKVKEYVSKALGLDEELGEAHATLADVLRSEWEWRRAEKEFLSALALNPNYATGHLWYSILLAQTGRTKEAIAEIERAHELDPNSLQILSTKGLWLFHARDYDGAIEIQEKVLQADPDFVPGLTNLFSILLCAERFEDARKLIPRIIETIGTPPSSYGSYAFGYAAVGDSVNARKFLEEARRVEGKQYFSRVDTAMAHYYLGETDLAFEWLDEAVEQKDSGVCSLKVDPTYDPLRADPRFAAILKRIGLGEGTL